MNKLLISKGISVALLLVSVSLYAEQDNIRLADILDATLEHQLKNITTITQEPNANRDSFSWIDGVPSVSLLYLHNQTKNGTREGEISFSIPIKSQIKTQAEKNLKSNSATIKNAAQRQLALYYSGMIRNLIWDLQTQKTLLAAQKRNNLILVGLVEKYATMAQLNALPKYALYLLQKEVNDSNILALQHEQNIQQLLSQYSLLTGLNILPSLNVEILPAFEGYALAQHPDIQALDAAWTAYDIALNGQGKSAEPWSVQLTTKRIETFNFSENQIGIGVDVPILLGQNLSATQRNEYRQAKMQYEIERNKLLVNIKANASSTQAEYDFLVEKQALLDGSIGILNALEKSINELLASNTLDQSVQLRNLIDLIDARNEIELNRIAINRQIALVRQTSGLPL